MQISRKFAAALLAGTMLAGGASAQTLVYCSEGSPEGFDPALYTAGTTFDASRPSGLQQARRVRPGHDDHPARPRRKAGRSPTMVSNTPSSCARGVPFHSNAQFSPSFPSPPLFPSPSPSPSLPSPSFLPPLSPPPPHARHGTSTPMTWCSASSGSGWRTTRTTPSRAAPGSTSAACPMPDLIQSVEKVDDRTVKFVLSRPEAPMIANPRDGLRLYPVGRVWRRDDGGGNARDCFNQRAHLAPGRSSSSPTRRTR